MTTKDDHGYREDWDMTTEEGSMCFASCIYAKLIGGEQSESDLTWLANYLRVNSSACRARTALSQPEPEGPTDEELLAIAIESELVASNGTNPFREDSDIEDEVMQFARAILARWGRPATEPEPNGQT